VSTVVVSARPAAAPAGVRHLAAPLMAWLSAAVDAAFRFHAQRRDERVLRAMADHQLHDLGITRSDVPRVVREGR
jgi:uncharacterized protein YjiS (DUF1127 family)